LPFSNIDNATIRSRKKPPESTEISYPEEGKRTKGTPQSNSLDMPHHEENNFSAPAEVVDFSALLFDMDGTIIDSTPAIVKYWQETGRQIGVDGDGE
jgi:hypothetical protein